MCRNLVKTIVKKRKGPKQSIEKHWGTIYRNTTLAKPTLERRMGIEGAKADAGKRSLSYNMVNAIGDNNLRALRRPNKGKKYNGNIFKDRNNKSKRLALLGKGLSR